MASETLRSSNMCSDILELSQNRQNSEIGRTIKFQILRHILILHRHECHGPLIHLKFVFYKLFTNFATWWVFLCSKTISNHIKSSIFHYSKQNYKKFILILQYLKWFYYKEILIEWQNSRKAFKKQTLVMMDLGPVHLIRPTF